MHLLAQIYVCVVKPDLIGMFIQKMEYYGIITTFFYGDTKNNLDFW